MCVCVCVCVWACTVDVRDLFSMLLEIVIQLPHLHLRTVYTVQYRLVRSGFALKVLFRGAPSTIKCAALCAAFFRRCRRPATALPSSPAPATERPGWPPVIHE